MTEVVPPPQSEQEPLFGMDPGAYDRDTIRYPEPDVGAAVDQDTTYTPPERPKPLHEMTAEEMIEVSLADRLEPDIHGFFDPKRADFIKKRGWTPYKESEVTASIASDRFDRPPLVVYLIGANKRGGRAAAKSVVEMVDQLRAFVPMDVEELRSAQDLKTEEFYPETAKRNSFVLEILAKKILADNCLNLFEWPNPSLKSFPNAKASSWVDQKLKEIELRLAFMPDPAINTLCKNTIKSQQDRGRFFAHQYELAEKHPDTQDIVLAARIHV